MRKCPRCNHRHERSDWKCPSCAWAPAIAQGIVCFAPDVARSEIGFDPEFFPRLAEVESRHFWFRWRSRLIEWAFIRSFPAASSVLEIGCGTGFVLNGLSLARRSLAVTGSEIYPEGLAFAKQRIPNGTFMQMDARRLPYVEEFDVVCAFDVVEHIEEDEVVVRNMRDSVKTGGGVIISVPQHRWLWSGQDVAAGHKRRYRRKDLIALLDKVGLVPVLVTSFVSLLAPLLVLTRLLRRNAGDDPMAEFRIGPVSNWILGMVMRLEFALIRLGLRIPVGGSLLVVARKP